MGSGRLDSFDDLSFTAGAGEGGALQQILSDGTFVVGTWLVGFEALGEFIGVIEDRLDGFWHGGHLVSLGRADMAWTMNSTPSAVTTPISRSRPFLERLCGSRV